MTFLAWNPNLHTADANTSRTDMITRQAVPISPDTDNEADTPPDWNEARQDDDQALPFPSRRFQAPDTEDAHNIPAWWADVANEQTRPDASTGSADKGTFAARERSGEAGKQSLRFSWDIDPAVRENGQLGGDYFVTDEQPIQENVTGRRGVGVQVEDQASVWTVQTDASEKSAKARARMTSDYDGIWGDLTRG